MKQFYGKSQNGNLREAAGGLRNPQLILLMSNSDQFSAHVSELESLFPGVPSIGCIGMSYDTTVVEKGVGIVAFTDHINAAAGVIEQVSTMPVKYINRLKEDVQRLGARQKTLSASTSALAMTHAYSPPFTVSSGQRIFPSWAARETPVRYLSTGAFTRTLRRMLL